MVFTCGVVNSRPKIEPKYKTKFVNQIQEKQVPLLNERLLKNLD